MLISLLVLICGTVDWDTRGLQFLIWLLFLICDIVGWNTWVRNIWNYLSLKENYYGWNLEHDSLCEGCIFGKQQNVTFFKIEREPKDTNLELTHVDLQGLSTITSLESSNYYITFIDDSSWKVWGYFVYFLKNKPDIFYAFEKLKVMVENETYLKVKCLQSNNGEECKRWWFHKVLCRYGIKMKNILGIPQQNSVVGRMNRTLNVRAKSMKLHTGLLKMFWDKAVDNVVYVIHRGPSTPLNCKISKEVWSSKEVKLSHLKVFGFELILL